jgi:hypothetical protein
MATTNIDELNFNDLVSEGMALLPIYAPEWTNHNPSDPGVTLVELLAYFTDILLYRAGRVTPAALLQFLRLLNGGARHDCASLVGADRATLQSAIERVLQDFGEPQCAATAADFEQLALLAARRHASHSDSQPHEVIARCVVDADLSGNRQHAMTKQTGHVSVIVAQLDQRSPEDAARLRARVRRFLLPRCLLTTRLHVVAPDTLYVGIGFDVALLAGVSPQAARPRIAAALQARFGYGGAAASADTALGAPLILAEVARTIDDVPDVDYVENLSVLQLGDEPEFTAHREASLGVQIGTRSSLGIDTRIGGPPPHYNDRLIRDSEGVLASITLRPWELLRLSIAHDGMREIDRDRSDPIAYQGGRDE